MNYRTKHKFLPRVAFLPIVLISLFIITSCGGGGDDGPPPPTDQEIAQELLESTWDIGGGTISLDGNSVSDRYSGFTLTIGDGSFTTTNAGDLFPATGTWSWIGESDNMVRTGNGKEITINELTSSTFSFSFQKTDQNVAAGIPGNYAVTLTR